MVLIILNAVFITFLLIANIIAVKIIETPVPFTDWRWSMTVSIIVYPFTFLISDTIAEVYGRRIATRVIWIGFGCSLILVILVYLANIIPPAGFWEDQPAFDAILGGVPRVALGSMIAYLIAQHHDVIAFHLWKRYTKGRRLWLRNNASTIVSQALDTSIFVTIAFVGTMAASAFWEIMLTLYATKVLIALADTPVVYGLIALIRKYGDRLEAMMPMTAEAEPETGMETRNA